MTDRLERTIPIFFERLAFPGEDRHPGFRHGSSGMILSRENVAASPPNLAPRSTSVSIRTAVCTVICSEPVIRTPWSGLLEAYFSRIAISPGISCSAISMDFRPHSARVRSLTLNSGAAAAFPLPLVVLAGRAFPGLVARGRAGIKVAIILSL